MSKRIYTKPTEFLLELEDLKKEAATLKARLRKLSECLEKTTRMIAVEQMLLLTTTTEK